MAKTRTRVDGSYGYGKHEASRPTAYLGPRDFEAGFDTQNEPTTSDPMAAVRKRERLASMNDRRFEDGD